MPEIVENFIDYSPMFLQGLNRTLQLSAWSIVLAVVIGFLVAFMRMSKLRIVRALAGSYLGIVRGTPLVAQLFVIYYGLVEFVDLGSYWSAVAGLSFHSGAYVAEIFRGGIQSIGKGQTEAARSMGMSHWRSMRVVVLPQAFRSSIPALGNQFIIAIKDSSIAAFITIPELFLTAQRLSAATFRPLEAYTFVAIYYFVIIALLTQLVRVVERRTQSYTVV